MSRSVLLQTRSVRPMEAKSLELLNDTLSHARSMYSIFVRLPPEDMGRIMGAAMTYMRRWSVEIVIIIGEKGPISFGDLSRALGKLPSGSLTPRLRDLEAKGLLARTPVGDAEGRVVYELTPEARPLADASYALTLGKSHHHACVRNKEESTGLPALDPPSPIRADPADLTTHAKRYIKSATAFRMHHASVSEDGEFEVALETARRYCLACTRKWHAGVMWTLATMGPHTFSALKQRTGAGDEALSTALRGLAELKNVELVGEGASRKYQMAPFGHFDMSLGMGAVSVYEDIESRFEGRSSLIAYTR